MPDGMYRGRPETNPGKLMYRHKGSFWREDRARAAQEQLKAQGLKTKVVKFSSAGSRYPVPYIDPIPPYSLYVMAKHDFWGNNFIWDRVR